MLETAYVITWRYSDGSGSGATAAFTNKARAEKLVEILLGNDSARTFKIEAVPFDFGTVGVTLGDWQTFRQKDADGKATP